MRRVDFRAKSPHGEQLLSMNETDPPVAKFYQEQFFGQAPEAKAKG